LETSVSAGLRGQISVAAFNSASSVSLSPLTAALRALAIYIAEICFAVSMADIGLETSKSFCRFVQLGSSIPSQQVGPVLGLRSAEHPIDILLKLRP
jgi:hypothetical protein